MSQISSNLGNFFNIRDMPVEQITALIDSDQFKPIQKKISKELKSFVVPDILYEKIIRELGTLLNIDLQGILLQAWNASGNLHKYMDPKTYGDDDIIFLPLAEHSIVSELHPKLRPTINDISIGEIQFDVDLKISLKGAILKIRSGCIMEISITEASLAGSIRYQDFTLLQKEGDFNAFSGSLNLGDGIPIGEIAEKVNNLHNSIGKLAGQEEN